MILDSANCDTLPDVMGAILRDKKIGIFQSYKGLSLEDMI
jgi:hypothetical protein